MSDQESERPGGTQPGLKKSDVLTRQTGDGSFEFIVESGSAENFGYEAEPSADLGENAQLAVQSSDKKRAGLIGAGVLLLILLVGVGIALSKSNDSSNKADSQAPEQEVSGFRPYGGGEAVPAARVERSQAEPNTRTQRVVKPVEEPEEPEEQFAEEIIEEMPPNAEPIPESEWQVGETEQVEEENEDRRLRSRRSLARDRVNFRRVDRRSIQAEQLRSFSVSDSNQKAIELDRRNMRNVENIIQAAQPDDSAVEYQEDDMLYEDEEEVLEEVLEEDLIDELEYEDEYLEAE